MNSLMRYTPSRGLGLLRREIDRIFDDPFFRLADSETTGNGDTATTRSMMWAPQVDIVEMDDAYHLHLDLPGLAKKDVRVELHDGRLMISGERAETRETEGETVHRIERSSGRFYRAFSLPQVTDEADVRASMKNGVLTIRVAKPAESTPRRIDVA